MEENIITETGENTITYMGEIIKPLKEKKVLTEEEKNKIAFVTFIIEKFASGYKMNRQEAYRYLKKYGGLDYIDKCWWALHIDNPYWALRDIYKVCRSNGGYV